MNDLENLLEVINEIVILPIIIFTLFLLIYVARYFNRKDPDIIKARIFLKYNEFKKAFLFLALFAFLLIFHVVLVYQPHFFYSLLHCSSSLAHQLQLFFGLALSITMAAFAYFIYKVIK